jgi:hypothetical protein
MKTIAIIALFVLLLGGISFASISVVGDLTHERSLKPGESFEGTILLRNRGTDAGEVKVYQTDYFFTADGKNSYDKPGTQKRSNAAWITLSPSRLTVPPGETASVTYLVKVPDQPDLKGTYWSMIMVEPIAPTSPESVKPEKGKVKVGLATVIRYGVQMVTNVGPALGEGNIRFLDKKLVRDGEKRIFQIDLENISDRTLSPLLWVELYDKGGRFIGRFESRRTRIYPGCSVRHQIDLSDVPKGDYKAVVVADNGDENVFGAEYTLSVK